MKLMKFNKYLQQTFSRQVLLPETTEDLTLMCSKSCNFPFTCKFPMVMHFVLVLHKSYGFNVLVTIKLVYNSVKVSELQSLPRSINGEIPPNRLSVLCGKASMVLPFNIFSVPTNTRSYLMRIVFEVKLNGVDL